MKNEVINAFHNLAGVLNTHYGYAGHIKIQLPWKTFHQLAQDTTIWQASDRLVLWGASNIEITSQPKPVPPPRKADCCAHCTSFDPKTCLCSLQKTVRVWSHDVCDAFEKKV